MAAMLGPPPSPVGSGPTYESKTRSSFVVRAPTPDVKYWFESPMAVVVNCVTRQGGPVGPSAWPSLDVAIEPSELVAPSVPLLDDPSEPLPGDPSNNTAPSGERAPAATRAASSAALDGA